MFGNSPSPAIAIFGQRNATHQPEMPHSSDAEHFVKRHFYVNDGLTSVPTSAEAIAVLKDMH